MDSDIIIALVGGLVNMGLASLIPTLLKNVEQPFVVKLRQVFENNRESIVATSLATVLVIYLTLKAYPLLNRVDMPRVQLGGSGLNLANLAKLSC